MTIEEAKQFGISLLEGIAERNTGKYAENVRLAIAALTEHFLPSNLGEAAEKYAVNHQAHDIFDCYGNPESDVIGKRLAFMAGAKWMAEQGQTFEAKATRKYEGSLSGFVSYLVGDEAGAIHKLIDLGEEADVIVQIRKKQ